MKIEETASVLASLETTAADSPARAQEAVPVGSAQTQEDMAMCKIASSPAGDRESKVAELRRRYLEGSYQVDARQVSARMIEEHIAIRE